MLNKLSKYELYKIFEFLNLDDMKNMIKLTKRLNVIIDNEEFWMIICNNCNIKLNKRAKKYKTWKSLVIKNYLSLCRNCYKSLTFPYCNSCKNILRDYNISKLYFDKDEKCICKSTVLKEFHLSEKDLEYIDYISVPNPHYKCSGDMKLYEKRDVYVAMYNKYGDEKGYEYLYKRKNKKKIDKKKKLEHINTKKYKNICDEYLSGKISMKKLEEKILERNKREKKINELNLGKDYYGKIEYYIDYGGDIEVVKGIYGRRKKLVKELKKNNLELRSDSVLCKGYIMDDNYELEFVVNTMIEMDWLFKNTSYHNIMRELRRNYYMYDKSYEAKRRAIRKWLKYGNKNDNLPKHIKEIIDNL